MTSMNDKRALFIFMSAKGCGYCKRFKDTHYTQFRQALSQDNRVEFLEIELERTDSQIPKQYPKDLLKFIPGYPSFVLIPKDVWTSAMSKPDTVKLTGLSFNTDASVVPITDKTVKPASFTGADGVFNTENLMKWITRSLDLPLFTTQKTSGKATPTVVYTGNVTQTLPVDNHERDNGMCIMKYRPRRQ